MGKIKPYGVGITAFLLAYRSRGVASLRVANYESTNYDTMQYIIKIIIAAVLIVLISEIAKRSTFMGAILASLPLTSILAFVFLYVETADSEKVSALSVDIFWLVIPSLTLFLILPLLLKKGMNFYVSLGIACTLTVASYSIMIFGLKKLGMM